MDILKSAFDNDQQITCASWENGPLMVLAGPGAGKTRLLTHRISYLQRHHPKDKHRILALTYTNKAVNEMNVDLTLIKGYDKRQIWIGTFHKFCTYILKNYSCYIGIPRSFTIIDKKSQISIIKTIQIKNNMGRRNPELILRRISYVKRSIDSLDGYYSMIDNAIDDTDLAFYLSEYELSKQATNKLDYDDLIWKTIQLLTEYPIIKQIVRDAYRQVLIDECQDTTNAQYELIKMIIPDEKPNLFVVADENQCIYEWNNASIRILKKMLDKYKMETKTLNYCYRCPQEILDIASQIIQKSSNTIIQREGKLVSMKGSKPGCITIKEYGSDEKEAMGIVEDIVLKHDRGYNYNQFAIIGRNHFVFNEIKRVLSERIVPYTVVNEDIFEASSVPLYLASLRVLINHEDVESLYFLLERIFPEDKDHIELIIEASHREGTPIHSIITNLSDDGSYEGYANLYDFCLKLLLSEIQQFSAVGALRYIDDMVGLKDYSYVDDKGNLTNIIIPDVLWDVAYNFDATSDNKDLALFVSKIALEKEDNTRNGRLDSVHLLTIHTAKGTEYPFVYIVALEESIFPDYRSTEEWQMNEERRNLFVAMTRTEEGLTISYAKSSKDRNGNSIPRKPSILFKEIINGN